MAPQLHPRYFRLILCPRGISRLVQRGFADLQIDLHVVGQIAFPRSVKNPRQARERSLCQTTIKACLPFDPNRACPRYFARYPPRKGLMPYDGYPAVSMTDSLISAGDQLRRLRLGCGEPLLAAPDQLLEAGLIAQGCKIAVV